MTKELDLFDLPSGLEQHLLDRRDEAFAEARYIVRPSFPSQERLYRMPWEKLMEHVALDKGRTVERLRSALEGGGVADRFVTLPIECPVDEFCQGMLTLFEQLVTGYDRSNGFDLDLCFLARDIDDSSTWEVWFEPFPRFTPGKMVTSIVSPFAQKVPFLIFESIKEEGEEGIIGLFLAEKTFAGYEMAEVAHEFMESVHWCITNPEVWSVLLNRMCLSIVWSGGREGSIAVPKTVHDPTGVTLKSSLHVVER